MPHSAASRCIVAVLLACSKLSAAGFVNRKKQFPKSTWAFSADGCGIVVGSLMGSSPVTAYIESATGIKEGGRTGITALTTAICFVIALFFNPLIGELHLYWHML